MTTSEKTPKTVRLTFPEVEIMKIKKSLKPGEKLSEVLLLRYLECEDLKIRIKEYDFKIKKYEEREKGWEKCSYYWKDKFFNLQGEVFRKEALNNELIEKNDNIQIELRKTQSEVNRLKDEREKMSQRIATLQADIFAKETFWGKIKNLFA